MPRAGGIFSLVPGYFAVDGTTIEVSQHNPVFEDVAQALTDSLPRDGSAPMTGNLAMGSNKITNLAAATNPADAVRFDQVPVLTGLTATVAELNFTDVVTAPIQTQLDAKQPLDADLTAIAALATNGIVARTGAGTVATRAITAGAGVTVTDGDGVAGNPTISAMQWTYIASQATTSGTSFDFTGIGAAATELEIFIQSSQLSGGDIMQVRLGTAGGIIATGYDCEVGWDTGNQGGATSFALPRPTSAPVVVTIRCMKTSTNVWFASIAGSAGVAINGCGYVDLAAVLT
ncbi:MAG: hypothetical protein IT551_12255, partial [Novosphingobium sp.]|nr:hypothetical protein [Novosphingobium sp.]